MKRETNAREVVDLKAILVKIANHWYFFAISVVLCMALAFLFLKRANNQYLVAAQMSLRGPSLMKGLQNPI